MDYQLDMALYNGVFAVPNAIVDQYLKLASGDTLKVLLVLLRHSGESLTLSQLEAATNLNQSEIFDALAFWADLDLLHMGTSAAEIASFPILKEENPPILDETRPLPVIQEPDLTIKERTGTAFSQAIPAEENRIHVFSSAPPRPSQKEVFARLDESQDLRFLFDQYQHIFGKDPTPLIRSSLVMLYDWCALSAEILAMLMHYYHSAGITDWQSIEKKILFCKERGVDSFEKAESYILEQTQQHQQENQVKHILSIGDRKLTKREKDFIEKWFTEFQSTPELIELAYERTVDQTGKLAFPYISKILENWHKKGIVSLEEAKEEIKAGKGKQKSQAFENTSYNIDEMERNDMARTPKL